MGMLKSSTAKIGQWGRKGSWRGSCKDHGLKWSNFRAGPWERKLTAQYSFPRNLVDQRWCRLVLPLIQIEEMEETVCSSELGAVLCLGVSPWEREPSYLIGSEDRVQPFLLTKDRKKTKRSCTWAEVWDWALIQEGSWNTEQETSGEAWACRLENTAAPQKSTEYGGYMST